jgi:adenylate cyclase
LRAAETATEDLRFVVRGPRATRARIVLAMADESTLEQWREPLALWSRHLLQVARGARRAGARAVGVDIILSGNADSFLGDVATETLRATGVSPARAARLQSVLDSDDRFVPDTVLSEWIQDHPGFVVLADDSGHTLTPALRSSGADVALVAPGDPTGEQRSFPAAEEGGYTLPVIVAARALAREPASFGRRAFRINYLAPRPDRSFPRIPLHRLANPDAETERLVHGAIVLVGIGDPSFNDLHRAIGGRDFPGTEILAHAAATLIDGRALRRWPAPWETGLTLLLGGISAVGLGRLRFRAGALGATAGILGILGAAQLAFNRTDLLLPVAAPGLAVLLPFVFLHAHQALLERRTRREVERVFGQYLSPRVRDFLMSSPLHRSLGGQEANATVLFFDLRDSTAFAEGKGPQFVIDTLNELYGRTIPCIQAQQGLVLKYNGDGFVALFGVPMPQEDHAAAGVRAARAIQAEIRALNAERLERNQLPWRFACGVHSGPLVFGNLGIAERPEFTVIGDTVNVAARLQDKAKELNQEAMISDATLVAAGESAPAESFSVQIRGRTTPLTVHTLA